MYEAESLSMVDAVMEILWEHSGELPCEVDMFWEAYYN